MHERFSRLPFPCRESRQWSEPEDSSSTTADNYQSSNNCHRWRCLCKELPIQSKRRSEQPLSAYQISLLFFFSLSLVLPSPRVYLTMILMVSTSLLKYYLWADNIVNMVRNCTAVVYTILYKRVCYHVHCSQFSVMPSITTPPLTAR